jgi:hypothetical protein
MVMMVVVVLVAAVVVVVVVIRISHSVSHLPYSDSILTLELHVVRRSAQDTE